MHLLNVRIMIAGREKQRTAASGKAYRIMRCVKAILKEELDALSSTHKNNMRSGSCTDELWGSGVLYSDTAVTCNRELQEIDLAHISKGIQAFIAVNQKRLTNLKVLFTTSDK